MVSDSKNAIIDLQGKDEVPSLIYNRELSWLSFNYRVLQEALYEGVPLYERIKFLAIYSSNLEEFFRVRVASLRQLVNMNEKTLRKLDFDPNLIQKEIKRVVSGQQEIFFDIFYNKIHPELQKEGICILNENQINRKQGRFVKEYFENNIRPWARPMLIIKKRISAFLKNNTLYLLLRMIPRPDPVDNGEKKKSRAIYASLEIPTDHLARWLTIPDADNKKCVMFLDDAIRYNLSSLFPGYEIIEVKAAKLTRDGDLNLDDEYSGNIVSKIRKQIEKRLIGIPSRFVYDKTMSKKSLNYFTEAYGIHDEDLIPSDRYQNFEDLFSFPNFDRPDLENSKLQPIDLPQINLKENIFEQISGKQILLYFPYHKYDPVLNLLYQAARDPQVLSIKISLYRVAKESKIIKALRKAAEKGKDVVVFSEVKARFDEMSNILAAEKLESSGVNVLYSLPNLKVHAKICLITRLEDEKIKRYSYLSTGNFNEQTSKLYTDFGYFTSEQAIGEDIKSVFRILAGIELDYDFNKLIVAPNHMRDKFYELIDNEIISAEKGNKAEIFLKMNSLEDKKIIRKLYLASNAGVKIRLIIRGICCLVPGVKGMSENIEVISIVDRFLEHSRIFVFYQNGHYNTYLSSADWMSRNLSRRIETAFEIEPDPLKKIIWDILNMQWNDNVKSRIIDRNQENRFSNHQSEPLQSQLAVLEYLKNLVPIADEKNKYKLTWGKVN